MKLHLAMKLHSASARAASAASLRLAPAQTVSAPAVGGGWDYRTWCTELPAFPANNVWNTNISKLPVDKHNAAWMRSMDAGPGSSLNLHPDFGPDQGGYPYGMPFTVVTNKHKLVKIKFSMPARATTARTRSVRIRRSKAARMRGEPTGTRSW